MNLKDLKFYETTHRYFYKGATMIPVTSVFERTGLSDFSKVTWEVMEAANLQGDYVHEIARLLAEKNLNEKSVDERLTGFMVGLKKYFKENVKKVLSVEKPVCDPYHGYAGRPDIVYINFKNRVCLDDFKTPLRPHPTWKFQTAAYKNAWDKCYPKYPVWERAGVMLDGKGEYGRCIHHGAIDFDKFLNALEVTKIKIREGINT